MSGLFRLSAQDFTKGVFVAVGAAVFTSLGAAMNVPGFSFSAFDWGQLLQVAFASFLGYTSKNLLSDEKGKILGIGRDRTPLP